MSSSATIAAASKSPGAVNPLGQAKGVVKGRIDQGADYTFSGPLEAIGAGTINTVQDPGGFGTELVETLNTPIAGQHYAYYGLETGATALVTSGPVTAGEPIATGKGSGGVELGFASGPGGVPITPYAPGESHESNPTKGGSLFSSVIGGLGSAAGSVGKLFTAPSIGQGAIEAGGGLLGEGAGAAGQAVGEGIVNWIKPTATKLTLYAVLIFGAVALVLLGAHQLLRPLGAPSLKDAAGKAAEIGAAGA